MPESIADHIIDARAMEPPEPFVRTLEALETLPAQHKLLLILTREPFPLYRALENHGFAYQTTITPQGTVEVLIWATSS